MLGPGLGGLVLAVASWFIIPVVIVVVIRIGMRPTNERRTVSPKIVRLFPEATSTP